jgi:hypothetical protein
VTFDRYDLIERLALMAEDIADDEAARLADEIADQALPGREVGDA